MRLWQIDLSQFNRDQSELLRNVREFLTTGHIPLWSGLTFSANVRTPPLIVYLETVPMAITENAVLLIGFHAALDGLAALCLFVALRGRYGTLAASCAGVMYATCAGAVFYSRSLVNNQLVPLLCAVFLLSVVRFLDTRKPAWLAAATLSCGIALELHPNSAVILPVLIAVAIWGRKALLSKPMAAVALLLALTIAPYIYLEVQSGWSDFQAAWEFMRLSKELTSEGLYMASSLLAGDFGHQALTDGKTYESALSFGFIGWLLLGLLGFGAFWAVKRDRAVGVILAALVLIPVATTLRAHEAHVFPWYLQPMLPAGTALMGIGLASIRPNWLALALLCGLALWRIGDNVAFESQAATGDLEEHYGVPLRYSMQAADEAVRLSAGRQLYLAQKTEGHGVIFWYLTNDQVPVKGFAVQNSLVFPSDDATYMVEGQGHAMEALQRYFPPAVATVASSTGQPQYTFFRLPADAAARFEQAAGVRPLNASLGGLIRLAGYSAPDLAAGQRSPLALEWQVLQPAGDVQLRQFAHLVDAAGKTWSTEADFEGYPAVAWQPGEKWLSWFDLAPPPDLPTGGYWLDVGMYEDRSKQRLPVSVDGQPAGTSIRVGPMRVQGSSPQAGPVQATFGDIALHDVHVDGDTVTLTWSATARPNADYVAFVHALDANGQLVAQHDGPPHAGSFPTSLWQPGDVVADEHQLSGSLASARQLEIGLYTPAGTKRLPATGPDGQPLGDRLLIELAS